MATLTLDPDAVGHHDTWSLSAGPDKVSAMSAPDDDDTTYLNVSATARRQSFYVANVGSGSIPDGATINFIDLVIRARCTNPSGKNTIEHGVYDGVSEYENEEVADLLDGVGNYVDYTRTMTTDPVTGAAWAIATIRDWASGGATPRSFGMLSNLNVGAIRATTLQVVIDYTESPDVAPVAASVSVTPGTVTTDLESVTTEIKGWGILVP